MIKCLKEEQLARESVIRSIDRMIIDLKNFRYKIETSKNLFEVYFPNEFISMSIEYGKLVLLSMGYACQNSQEKN